MKKLFAIAFILSAAAGATHADDQVNGSIAMTAGSSTSASTWIRQPAPLSQDELRTQIDSRSVQQLSAVSDRLQLALDRKLAEQISRSQD